MLDPIPTVETARLVLRGHGPSDLADSLAMWADPAVVRYVGGRTSSQEEAWSRLLRFVGHWTMMGYGYWAVREKGSGRFVGEVGLSDFKRSTEPSFEGAPEAGWALAPWAHGRGYATEAVAAALAWFETRFGPTRTVCMIDPENTPSIRVATKCGYRSWMRAEYKGEPSLLFERVP